MAKAVINLQKESGGIVKISPVDGTGITEVTVPERGELATVDYVKNNGDTNAVTSFSQIYGTNEIVGKEPTDNIHDVFGDGSAVATYQLNGNANDLGGTYNGTVGSGVTYGTGKFGQCAKFSTSTASSNRITFPPTLFNKRTVFTVSYWTYCIGNYVDSNSFWVLGSTNNNAYDMNFSPAGLEGHGTATYNAKLIIPNFYSTLFTKNTWNHTLVLRDGSYMAVYYNGVKLAERNNAGAYYNSTTALTKMGTGNDANMDYSRGFNGSIDQLRIFNRALTETEISTLYTETRASVDTQLNINQGTFIYPKGLGTGGYIKSSDVFTGTVDTSTQTDGWKYVAKDENNNFSFYTDKPTIGKKSSTLYLENGRLYKSIDDTPITPISFLSNKVRIASGKAVELAPSDISKTVSESLEAGSYFGKNAIVAYASINMTTTPPTILDSYNIAYVIRSSNGVGKITLINPTDIDSITAICGSNSVAGTITSTTKNEVSFKTGTTNYANTSVIVIGGKF